MIFVHTITNFAMPYKNFYVQQQQHNQKYQQTRAIRFLLTSAVESMPNPFNENRMLGVHGEQAVRNMNKNDLIQSIRFE